MADVKVYEGSLRGSVDAGGNDYFWCELENHGHTYKRKLAEGITLSEARYEATRLEKTQTKQTVAEKRYWHYQTATEREMISEPGETLVGKFLCRELKIKPDTLIAAQSNEFILTVLKMHSPEPFHVTGRALRDSAISFRKAQILVDKMQNILSGIKYAPRESFVGDPGDGIWHHLLFLKHELVSAERVTNSQMSLQDRRPNADYAKKYFAELAIRTYLKWAPDWRRPEQLGITYPEDWRENYQATKNDNQPGSPLMVFLWHATESLMAHHVAWDFNIYDRANKFLHFKNANDEDLDCPIAKQPDC